MDPDRHPETSEPGADSMQVRIIERDVELRRPYWWWWLISVAAIVGTFFLARAIPPWHPIGTWWGDFLTSAGFGGSLAVLGAGTAAYIAYHNSRQDREQKRDADDLARWWDRFAWACEKAVSTEAGDSEMGLTVLDTLLDAEWTRDEDLDMTLAVITTIRRHVRGSSATVPTRQNGWRV